MNTSVKKGKAVHVQLVAPAVKL